MKRPCQSPRGVWAASAFPCQLVPGFQHEHTDKSWGRPFSTAPAEWAAPGFHPASGLRSGQSLARWEAGTALPCGLSPTVTLLRGGHQKVLIEDTLRGPGHSPSGSPGARGLWRGAAGLAGAWPVGASGKLALQLPPTSLVKTTLRGGPGTRPGAGGRGARRACPACPCGPARSSWTCVPAAGGHALLIPWGASWCAGVSALSAAWRVGGAPRPGPRALSRGPRKGLRLGFFGGFWQTWRGTWAALLFGARRTSFRSWPRRWVAGCGLPREPARVPGPCARSWRAWRGLRAPAACWDPAEEAPSGPLLVGWPRPLEAGWGALGSSTFRASGCPWGRGTLRPGTLTVAPAGSLDLRAGKWRGGRPVGRDTTSGLLGGAWTGKGRQARCGEREDTEN